MFTIMFSLMLAFSTYSLPSQSVQSQEYAKIKPAKPGKQCKPSGQCPSGGGFPYKDTRWQKPTPRGF